jgi:hypothetical protein
MRRSEKDESRGVSEHSGQWPYSLHDSAGWAENILIKELPCNEFESKINAARNLIINQRDVRSANDSLAVSREMSTHQMPVKRVPLSEAIEAALAPARLVTRTRNGLHKSVY